MSGARTAVRGAAGALAALGMSFAAVPAASANPGGVPATEHCAGSYGGYEGIKIEDWQSPANIRVHDTSLGREIYALVTVSGPYLTVEARNPDLELVDASWCVKAGTEVTYGTGTSGDSGIYNKNDKLKDISYVVIYKVTTKYKCPPKY